MAFQHTNTAGRLTYQQALPIQAEAGNRRDHLRTDALLEESDEHYLDQVDRYNLSTNSIHLLDKLLDKVNWHNLSANPNVIDLLKNNLNRVNWSGLSANPNAISLLEQYPLNINWTYLSANPNITNYIKKN